MGHNQLYTTSLSLQHDTRDNPFLASEGHLLSATFEETVGTFQYPRASVEWSQFFRIFERADRSGKHVLSFTLKAGYSGDDTPIFERYYAGGFSTIRGFAFRGVTPRDPVYGMGVGGDFQMLSHGAVLVPDHGRRHAPRRGLRRCRHGANRRSPTGSTRSAWPPASA